MKIRIQDSDKFIDVDVEHPYLLGDLNVSEQEFKPKLQDVINRDGLKCSGCAKKLLGKNWLSVIHRPRSSRTITKALSVVDEDNSSVYGVGEFEVKDIWAVFLFCSDTKVNCFNKWKLNRPK